MAENETKMRDLLDELAGDARLDPGLERPTLRRARRRRIAGAGAGVAVVLGVALAGFAFAQGLSSPVRPTGTVRPTQPPPTTTAPLTPTPTESGAGSPTPEPSVSSLFATDLGDGRYPAYVKGIERGTDPVGLRVDIVTFLTGDAANEYAASHGMETPVANDILIINQNPRLRLLPLAPDVEIRVIRFPCGPSCGPNETVDVATFEEILQNSEPLEDGSHAGRFAPYWLTIEDGTIVAIEEQYTP